MIINQSINHCLCQGAVAILTLLKKLLVMMTFHLLKGWTMDIDIMVIRFLVMISLCGGHKFCGFLLGMVSRDGHYMREC